jgi:hypothetical protein
MDKVHKTITTQINYLLFYQPAHNNSIYSYMFRLSTIATITESPFNRYKQRTVRFLYILLNHTTIMFYYLQLYISLKVPTLYNLSNETSLKNAIPLKVIRLLKYIKAYK